jgi:hypothetical protein
MIIHNFTGSSSQLRSHGFHMESLLFYAL